MIPVPNLVIRVECSDPTDLDWLRTRCHGAVEDVVAEAVEEGRMDGEVEVTWETED